MGGVRAGNTGTRQAVAPNHKKTELTYNVTFMRYRIGTDHKNVKIKKASSNFHQIFFLIKIRTAQMGLEHVRIIGLV